MATGRDAFGHLKPLSYEKPGLATCQCHSISSSCHSPAEIFVHLHYGMVDEVTSYCAEHGSDIHERLFPEHFTMLTREQAMARDPGPRTITLW